MLCAIVGCREARYVNGLSRPFCPDHCHEFEAAPEGKYGRPTDASDFRDRLQSERRVKLEAEKRATAEDAAKPKAKA